MVKWIILCKGSQKDPDLSAPSSPPYQADLYEAAAE